MSTPTRERLPNLKSALAYGMVFNEMLRHTDFLKMAALHHGCFDARLQQRGAVLQLNGLFFKMYRDHLGTLPVAVSGNSPQPAPK